MRFPRLLIGCFLLSPYFLHAQLTAFERDGKWGFKDQKGSIVVPAKYAGVGRNGLAKSADGGVVDVFSEGLAPVTMQGAATGLMGSIEGGKWGFVDAAGKEVSPLKYDEVEDFNGGYAVVTLGGKKGLLSKTGKESMAPRYDAVQPGFSEGLVAVQRNGLWGYADANGKEIIPAKFYAAEPFAEGLAAVAPEQPKAAAAGAGAFATYGFIDKSGRLLIPAAYGQAFEKSISPNLRFEDGEARVRKGTETVYINTKGAEVAPSMKHRLYDLYADSYNGFKKSQSADVLQRDAAGKVDYYAVEKPVSAPGAGGVREVIAVAGNRKIYALGYERSAPGADAALAAMKALIAAAVATPWNFTQYYKDLSGDAEGNATTSVLQHAANGLPDPRTTKLKLTEGEKKIELLIIAR